jgi:hypothetical protein
MQALIKQNKHINLYNRDFKFMVYKSKTKQKRSF